MRVDSFFLFALCFSCGAGCSPNSPMEMTPPPIETPTDPPVSKSPMLGPIVRLSNSPTDSQTFLNTAKCVAVTADGVIHVAWLEIIEAKPFPGHAKRGQIVYIRSSDGGNSFSTPRFITPVIDEVGTPKIAAAGNSLYMVWHQFDGQYQQIILGYSDDSGMSWIPYAAPLGPGTYPSIDAWTDGRSAPSIHVAWSNSQVPSGISEIYLANSSDGARAFSKPLRVSPDDGRSSWTAAVASYGQVVHVAWTDDRYNIDDLGKPYDCGPIGGGPTCHEEEFYRRSTDGGASFSEAEARLTSDPPNAPKYSWAPSIVAGKQDVHIVYFDQRSGTFQLYHRRSRDAGKTWDADVSLTSALDSQPAGGWWRPSLSVSENQLRLTFWRQADAVVSSVWAMTSADTGVTWTAPVLLSEGSAALQPAVAMGLDGVAHFVWYDSVAGNQELYYRRMAAR